MMRSFARRCVLLAAVSIPVVALGQPSAAPGAARVKVGTFDSRAVAMAYANSPLSAPEREALAKDIRSATARGDRQKAEQLKMLGPSRQHLRHQQVFSNGSIVDIVPKFRDKLAPIAARHQVLLIVSRWEVPYADPSVDYIDVTDDVVALFNPSERVSGWIAQMKQAEPVPLQDLAYDPEH